MTSDEVVRHRNIDQVHAFFRSERELNLEAWSAIWADNAIRRTPFAPPGFARELQGKPAIVQALRGPFEQALRLTVQEEVFPTTDPRLVIARARTTGEMRNGATYENEVVAFFRFDDENRIVEWIGYINPLPILELMKEATSAAPADNGREQVLYTYKRLLDAWNRRDPDAFASLFGETGSVVGFDGSQMNGQSDIAATLRAIFADHQTARYVAKLREIKPLGSATMLLRAVVGMIPPGKTQINPAVNAVQSLVVVIEEERPRIALLHNTPAALHGRPHVVEQLTEELAEVARQGQLVAEAG
jgi:uncharacterized protein (TIGR02246 family)